MVPAVAKLAQRFARRPEPPVRALGVARVRRALHDAVAVRAHGRTSLSADLSGGMDSTSVCFLAAGKVERLLTVRAESGDPGDEDGQWAGLAAAALPHADLGPCRRWVLCLDAGRSAGR
ncbi:asparagine synthase-related protein [Actinomadura harenae]|uniref:Asparagine synthetase domain-containing protein n=1 Tax=Actinomadura harenae TaxID=2483351 RepID=A0A3M2M156_9ACTN|nr:hypothetical protein EBO15_16545 [Actinomadura harenae]